jgi:formate hydrogenlyase subunit 3/multisubunit Na+/H+ antiporter MnhD subunit
MTAALFGVAGYLALGVLGFLGRGWWLGVLAWATGVGSLIAWAPGFPETVLGLGPWGIRLVGDTVALGFWSLALVLHAAVLWEERRQKGAFHPLLTLLVGTTLALVLSQDLFNLYVCLELTSLLSFLLVGYESRPASVWASLQYLILTTVGMILYLFGVGLVYGRLGTLALSEISHLAEGGDPALSVGAGLLLSGAAVKGGVFLFGLWLPWAHGRAPHSVSALLSGLVVKMGIVTLFRLGEAFSAGPVLVTLGILTGFGGLVYALWEQDLKYFLAYHTTSQLGYMLIGFGLFGAWGGSFTRLPMAYSRLSCFFPLERRSHRPVRGGSGTWAAAWVGGQPWGSPWAHGPSPGCRPWPGSPPRASWGLPFRPGGSGSFLPWGWERWLRSPNWFRFFVLAGESFAWPGRFPWS